MPSWLKRASKTGQAHVAKRSGGPQLRNLRVPSPGEKQAVLPGQRGNVGSLPSPGTLRLRPRFRADVLQGTGPL